MEGLATHSRLTVKIVLKPRPPFSSLPLSASRCDISPYCTTRVSRRVVLYRIVESK